MDCRMPTTGFLGAPVVNDPVRLTQAFAYLGMPFGVPYGRTDVEPPAAGAPDAVRAASLVYVDELRHFDFDLGTPFLPAGSDGVLADCGDVRGDPNDPEGNVRRATEAVRTIVTAGAVPLVVGGDHSIPPLVVRALPETPLDVLHVDAHLDYRDEVGGVRDGFSSPIRRLRDLSWVGRIVQVGLRDIGSARAREVDDALAAGNILVTAEQVHEGGVEHVVDQFEPGARLYITIDVDGLDPSCAPGTLWPAPGGLLFWQAAGLVRDLTRRCTLVGVDVCEFAPGRDVQGLTALAVTRLLMLAIGAAGR